jgi:hypothetical protein
MFAEQIMSFSQNLNNLRDFVQMVASFLDEKKQEEIKENAEALLPLMLAMHKLNPEESPLDEDEISKLEKKVGAGFKVSLIEEDEENEATIEGKSEKKGIKFKLEGDGNSKFSEAMKVFGADQHRKTALYCNSLISLVSSVEWFLAQLIHKHYKENPGIVGSKEKQFSLEELAAFETVDDARNYLIEKTVESVLRGSIQDWIDFLSSKLKLSMGYLNEHKDYLIEVTQRRNLLVHNGGVVNRIYLSNLPISYKNRPKIGDNIHISSEYLNNAISTFERCFLLIAAELWKKVGANNEERGKLLINLSYENLVSERYEVAESISFFAANDKSLQESDRLYAKINYWIAKKYGGDFESIKREIIDEDFSAKSRLFILAKKVLLGDFEGAYSDIKYLLDHDESFTLEEVKLWPLFKEFREQEFYNELTSGYEEVHEESLEMENSDDATDTESTVH